MRYKFAFVTLIMLFSAVAACVNNESSKPILYFSGIPDQNISTWSERYSILENYLTEELGVEVKGIPSKDSIILSTLILSSAFIILSIVFSFLTSF